MRFVIRASQSALDEIFFLKLTCSRTKIDMPSCSRRSAMTVGSVRFEYTRASVNAVVEVLSSISGFVGRRSREVLRFITIQGSLCRIC